MKAEVKTPALVAIVVLVVAAVAYFGMKFIGGVGNLDQGQISYTPGVPPWAEKDPAKKAQFSKMPGELHNYSQAAEAEQRAAHGPQGPK